MDFKTSETAKNLMRAFAGESQARNRYTFAAGIAKEEKLPVIEAVFQFTADQEKEHAEIFYNYLKELTGQTIHVDGGYPVDISQKTLDLLKSARHNEYEEHDVVYQAFGDKAKEEGFEEIGRIFHQMLMPREEEAMSHFLELVDKMLASVDCYLLQCNKEREAALAAYEGMRGSEGADKVMEENRNCCKKKSTQGGYRDDSGKKRFYTPALGEGIYGGSRGRGQQKS